MSKTKECYGCEDRYPGCHSKCEHGLARDRERDRIRAERNKARVIDAYMGEQHRRAHDAKIKKQKRDRSKKHSV